MVWRAIALFLKMFATVLVQAYSRFFKSAEFDNPEDLAVVTKIFGERSKEAIDNDLARRAQNVLRNDGENIPIFLFLAMTYVQLDCWETGVLIYFPIFVLTRIVHAIAYIKSIQPLRNIVYLLGVGVSFMLCSHIAWNIFVTWTNSQ